MRKFYMLFSLLIVGVSTIFTTGCEKDSKKIQIAEVTHSVFYAPQYVALSEGFFDKYGLDVEIFLASGADKVMASLLSGDAHIGLMGPEASIYVYAQGKKDYAITFAQLTQKDGSFIVGRENNTNFKLSDLNGKSILAGRRGGMPLMTLEYILKQEELNPEKDNDKANINLRTDVAFSAQAGAFISGEGDYTTLFEPTASELEAQGKGYVLASVGAYTDNVAYTCYSTLKSYMDKNDIQLVNFSKAISEAIEWVYSHSSMEVANSIHKYFSETDIDILTNSIERYRKIDAWSLNPYLDEEEFKHLQDIIIASNELDKYMPYDKLVVNKFNQEKR